MLELMDAEISMQEVDNCENLNVRADGCRDLYAGGG
jgi:hypothetical protein